MRRNAIRGGVIAAGLTAALAMPAAGFGGATGPDRVSGTEKGSVLIFSKVELRWDKAGFLIQDTFIDITNDYPGDVLVQLYFINGDPALPADPATNERAHPGCNNVDNLIQLTMNEPTYWSAATGLPKGVSPFTVLDPGFPPGRPDPEGSTERVLRGYIIAIAVNAAGEEIRWNHLKGDVTIVNYNLGTAWEYNAWAFAAVTGVNGAPTGTPGVLNLNGAEYVPAYSDLLLDFYAVGSEALSVDWSLVTVDTDLTLHPVSHDLRVETTGPVRTRAEFDVWNMNEMKLSGAYRCIECWDQALLSTYGTPNHFLLEMLQTDKGKARINGVANGAACSPAVNAALLGVAAKHLVFDYSVNTSINGNGAMESSAYAVAGTNLVGMGTEPATIFFNIAAAPPESANPSPQSMLNSVLQSLNGDTDTPPNE